MRNAALQAAFFHNGAFTRLEDAIRHHLNIFQSVQTYDPHRAGLPDDLCVRAGPMAQALSRVDPLLAGTIDLKQSEFNHLVAFVRDGLLDPRAAPQSLCRVIPAAVPSGRPLLHFQDCR